MFSGEPVLKKEKIRNGLEMESAEAAMPIRSTICEHRYHDG